MTPFEFVFALISIITSLAVTQIITGVIAIVRHKDRADFSLAHALWVWTAFAVVIANWGAFWGTQGDPDWPPLRVIAWITSMTSLYAFCALVIPDVARDTLNLREFHEREGRRYIIAHNLFAALAIVLVLAISGIRPDPIFNLIAPIIALVMGSAALFTRGRAQLAASILVAMLASLFMLSSIDIVAS